MADLTPPRTIRDALGAIADPSRIRGIDRYGDLPITPDRPRRAVTEWCTSRAYPNSGQGAGCLQASCGGPILAQFSVGAPGFRVYILLVVRMHCTEDNPHGWPVLELVQQAT